MRINILNFNKSDNTFFIFFNNNCFNWLEKNQNNVYDCYVPYETVMNKSSPQWSTRYREYLRVIDRWCIKVQIPSLKKLSPCDWPWTVSYKLAES